jgi:hypothetical protein
MQHITSNAAFSAAWIHPVPLPFFQNDAEYLGNFTGFDLSAKLDTEKNIAAKGNTCNKNSPIIKYDRCSDKFNSLWFEAARSTASHLRKQGPAVISGRTALIWPGLSVSHFLGDSIPAWSIHRRPIAQVFGKWIFDSTIQCRAATIDTAVCADADTATNAVKMEAVIPWLGSMGGV